MEKLALVMPGGCTVIGVNNGKKVAQATAQQVDVFDSTTGGPAVPLLSAPSSPDIMKCRVVSNRRGHILCRAGKQMDAIESTTGGPAVSLWLPHCSPLCWPIDHSRSLPTQGVTVNDESGPCTAGSQRLTAVHGSPE